MKKVLSVIIIMTTVMNFLSCTKDEEVLMICTAESSIIYNPDSPSEAINQIDILRVKIDNRLVDIFGKTFTLAYDEDNLEVIQNEIRSHNKTIASDELITKYVSQLTSIKNNDGQQVASELIITYRSEKARLGAYSINLQSKSAK